MNVLLNLLPSSSFPSDEQADGSSPSVLDYVTKMDGSMSMLDHIKSFRPSSFPSAWNDVRISPPVLESSDEQADGSSHPGRFDAIIDKENRHFFFSNRRFVATSDKENRKNSMESHREHAQENFLLECEKYIRLLAILAAPVTNQAGKYYFRAFGHMVHNVVAEAAPTWELWSGSTHHATGNRAFLQNYETVDGLIIQLGDGMCMPVTGRGTVVMDTMVLPDVWFVPDLKRNIVSVSQLAELDCNIVFKRDACYISSATDGSIIGKALLKENSMFKLEFLKVPLDN